MEDWAEAFALTVAHDPLGFQYGIAVDGAYFNMTQHFRSEATAAKYDFVRRFIAAPKNYPGPQK